MTGFKKRKDERRVKARALIIEEEKKVKYLNKVEKKKYREEINEQYENIKEAVELDKRLINAWVGHPHFSIIQNGVNSFQEKID